MLSLWTLLYNVAYCGLVAFNVANTIFPIIMILAMFLRQSRVFYSFFNKADKTSPINGGELVAKVLKSHGIVNIFALPGGHVTPISVAADKLDIRVVEVRHEATAVFAADASARLSGIPGVALVTAGPGLTNTVTAVKNAQMAESPVVIIAGAAATLLKGRGSLQDIDQMALLKSTTKKCFSVTTTRDIVTKLRDAFKVSQTGVPGPVFIEFPADVLYPYSVIAKQLMEMSPTRKKFGTNTPATKPSLKSRLVDAYLQFLLNNIFAGLDHKWETSPHPISLKYPKKYQIDKTIDLLLKAQRPVIILGSQAILRPFGPNMVAECIERLGVPVYLDGSARGLLGIWNDMQFRHAHKEAVREADVVLVLGAICDFRLGYGSIFSPSSKIVCVNRSKSLASLNSGIMWNPDQIVECDVGKFIVEITTALNNIFPTNDVNNNPDGLLSRQIDRNWCEKLKRHEQNKNDSIDKMSRESPEKYLNPLKVIKTLDKVFENDDKILVADGGDFVASAPYILKPNGPCRWLDSGPFGTLGCGAGFALAAKLLYPDRKVVAVMGDGAFGYAIPELDTFVRQNLPVYMLIGNDACRTQIASKQLPVLGSTVSCELDNTNYHAVADGFGAKGFWVNSDEHLDEKKVLAMARKCMIDDEKTVVVNALIGKTKFRDGSLCV